MNAGTPPNVASSASDENAETNANFDLKVDIFPKKKTNDGFEMRRKNVNQKSIQLICKSAKRQSDPCKGTVRFDRNKLTGMVDFCSGVEEHRNKKGPNEYCPILFGCRMLLVIISAKTKL